MTLCLCLFSPSIPLSCDYTWICGLQGQHTYTFNKLESACFKEMSVTHLTLNLMFQRKYHFYESNRKAACFKEISVTLLTLNLYATRKYQLNFRPWTCMIQGSRIYSLLTCTFTSLLILTLPTSRSIKVPYLFSDLNLQVSNGTKTFYLWPYPSKTVCVKDNDLVFIPLTLIFMLKTVSLFACFLNIKSAQ